MGQGQSFYGFFYADDFESRGLSETIAVTLPRELYATLEEEAARTGRPVNDIVVKLVKFRHEAINGEYA